MSRDDPYIVAADNDNRSAQVIQIDSGKHISIAVACAVMCTVTMLGTVWALYQSAQAERETRMTQYYIMELDGKLMKSGFLNPAESYAAKQEQRK